MGVSPNYGYAPPFWRLFQIRSRAKTVLKIESGVFLSFVQMCQKCKLRRLLNDLRGHRTSETMSNFARFQVKCTKIAARIETFFEWATNCPNYIIFRVAVSDFFSSHTADVNDSTTKVCWWYRSSASSCPEFRKRGTHGPDYITGFLKFTWLLM